MERTNKGRQKIEIARITNEKHRLVTFSKRRSGLFKKASELSTLCGVEIAIITFSPSEKVYSFGHPSVESVINRYLGENENNPSQTSDPTLQLLEVRRDVGVRQLNQQWTEAINQLEEATKRGKELDQMTKKWEARVDNLKLEELEDMKRGMEQLKNNVANQKLMMQMPPPPATSSFTYGGLLLGNGYSVANDATTALMMPHGYANAMVYGSGAGQVGSNASDVTNAGPSNVPFESQFK